MDNLILLTLIIFGLPTIILLELLVPIRAQKSVIILGSLFFYAIISSFSPEATIILIGLSILNYISFVLGVHISNQSFRKTNLGLIVFINVISLIIVKYFNLPVVGISFYIFTVIGLQVDLYTGEYEEKLSAVDFFVFLLAFPRLMMGPIARIGEMKESIYGLSSKRGINSKLLKNGVISFIIGLSLKTLIADQLATLWNSICVSGVLGIGTGTAWIGAIGYTLELYLDFWGYSLVAIGLGNMVGLDIPVNFNNPYLSASVSEFWRRWHITLGTWFRDYIYIPMGGNREGKKRQILNLMVVWLLTGLWHGLDYNFVVWGLLLGVVIIIEKMTPFGTILEKGIWGNVFVLIFMPFTWMIFAHNNLNDALVYIKCMIGLLSAQAVPAKGQLVRYLSDYWYIILPGMIMLTPYPAKLFTKIRDCFWMNFVYIFLFWSCIWVLYNGTNNPFMYAAF